MDKNRIAAIGHQFIGTKRESLGQIIGDEKLKADGATERETGEAQNAAWANANPLIDIGIDTDRIAGIGHQFKGALKERLGKLSAIKNSWPLGSLSRWPAKRRTLSAAVETRRRRRLNMRMGQSLRARRQTR